MRFWALYLVDTTLPFPAVAVQNISSTTRQEPRHDEACKGELVGRRWLPPSSTCARAKVPRGGNARLHGMYLLVHWVQLPTASLPDRALLPSANRKRPNRS